MAIFKCKMCGGSLEITEGLTVVECEYCTTKQPLPRLDNDKKANLYDRAGHFRRNNEFDKAISVYEKLLDEDSTDPEAYWSLVLCKYGIEYVEDPVTHKRVPTVNRVQFTSVFADENYKSALKYADVVQKELYEAEAHTIDEIQKGILAIAEKEEPFDVFISYKETDNNGKRTPDSVLANDLYHQLTQEGYKVFFSRITLEDKLGTAYEPYIFAALNSAKVMVVLGTNPEYFNAVWVKNEWSRYLALIKNGEKKILIPAYKDMDPYDLPEEFSHLQAQDMSKLGFMQDLIRGIKKITAKDEPKPVVQERVVVNDTTSTNISALLRRAFLFLEDGEWTEADKYCEKVLDLEPTNAEAYLGKLMCNLKVKYRGKLSECSQPFDNNKNYLKAIRFSGEIQDELQNAIKFINERNEAERKQKIYFSASSILNNKSAGLDKLKSARDAFMSISDYNDASALARKCDEKANDIIYNNALEEMNKGAREYIIKAYKLFLSIGDYRDASKYAEECRKTIEGMDLASKEKATNIFERYRKIKDALNTSESEAFRKKEKIKSVCGALTGILGLVAIILCVIELFSDNEFLGKVIKIVLFFFVAGVAINIIDKVSQWITSISIAQHNNNKGRVFEYFKVKGDYADGNKIKICVACGNAYFVNEINEIESCDCGGKILKYIDTSKDADKAENDFKALVFGWHHNPFSSDDDNF